MKQAILIVLAVVFASVQTALPAALGLSMARIDLVLCIVLWLGLTAPVIEGALLALWCGYVTDLYAGGPPMLFGFLAVMTFVMARLFAAQLAGEGWTFAAALAFSASALQGTLAFALLWIFRSVELGPSALWAIPTTAGLTALAAPACFGILGLVDRLFQRVESGELK